MRLDKYLSMIGLFTRKESRKRAKKGIFSVNGKEVLDQGTLIKEGDLIGYGDQEIIAKWNCIVLLNKPAGYLSADHDEANHPSYRNLLLDYPYVSLLRVAGRLDVDTEGLLVLTSDGQLNHRIRSPKHHYEKVYQVTTSSEVTAKQCKRLAKGVILDDDYTTKPAKCEQTGDYELHLTLHEGKFHQVKRMLEAVGNSVSHLKRLSVGPWTLEGIEKPGSRKEIELPTAS